MLSSAVYVSVPKKWNHGQMTWFQERKLPPSQAIYKDLLHAINKGHKQQIKTQHAALILTHSIQTFTPFHCAMIRGTVVLQEGMNSCWWAQSTIPVFQFSCAGDDEASSCLYQFEGLDKASRLKSQFTLHNVFQTWAASLICQGFGVLGSSSKLSVFSN